MTMMMMMTMTMLMMWTGVWRVAVNHH